MSIFKCKMCGGALEINNNETVITCEYCGTQQTLPKLQDDEKSNLYDRANHFRRNNEYDKAMSIYEKILNSDNTDSEAYWSLVLCRYGIEYVEDPATHKRVPTVNRTQFTSIYDDDNYKSAINYADGYQKSVYEEEAKAINEIQKGILAISQKEEPFDVFICYKETDNSGRRTQDSVLANDLYHQLTQEGFKVFFARITLEDKLGSAYEPYIFAALNSSKVMVVIGTKPEYFNAVWVKNEWSRYLSLIKNGENKMLIPAYKDMDPYDLPEEFSHLQAQDMSKLGFMQDLIRGIKKIAQSGEEKKTIVHETVVSSGSADTAPLLKRAFMFLEDGDFTSADEYCEKVLDMNPENAEAYLGKLMAELKVSKRENLKNCENPFDGSLNYQKIIRFGDEKFKNELNEYISFIKTRNENNRIESIYRLANSRMNEARDEDEFKAASETFLSISDYKDSKILSDKCLEKAEASRKSKIYSKARFHMENFTISEKEKAIELFSTIPGWQDSDEMIQECKRQVEELKAKDEADRLEKERQEQIAKAEKERAVKRNKKIAIITTPIVCAIIAFIIILNAVIIPNGKYDDAIALMDAGKYAEAITAFENLEGYKDSTDKITKCKYNDAIALMDAGKYAEAITAFENLEGYKDSTDKITECKYNDAIALMDTGKYREAMDVFKELNGYGDSNQKITEYESRLINTANVGDCVFFGAYEQDNNTANGKEDIEWLVLEKQDDKALVISKYALDAKHYHKGWSDATWETCALREWLNNDFINDAFSDEEKKLIPTVTVEAHANPEFDTDPGNATQDKVFLLSIDEANKYFSSDSARQCEPTDYAFANGLDDIDNGNCRWWLRSPGNDQDNAADVYVGGDVHELGVYVRGCNCAVRPALWIDLN